MKRLAVCSVRRPRRWSFPGPTWSAPRGERQRASINDSPLELTAAPSAPLPVLRAVRDGTLSKPLQTAAARPLSFRARGCRAEPDYPRDGAKRSRSHRRRPDEVGTPRRRAGRLGMQATQFLAEPDPWGSRARGNGGAGRRSRRQEEEPDTRARNARILPGVARGMTSVPTHPLPETDQEKRALIPPGSVLYE